MHQSRQKTTPPRALAGAVIIAAVCGILVLGFRRLLPQERSGAGVQAGGAAEPITASPNLTVYRETRRVHLPLDAERALCVAADDTLYVAGESKGARMLYILPAAGKAPRIVDLVLSEAALGPVTAVAVHADGRIYLGVGDHVEIVTAEGRVMSVWPSLGGKSIITAITIAGGLIYLADAGRRVVHRFAVDGRSAGRLRGSGRVGFLVPSPYFDIAGRADGSLWVVDPGRYTLELYTAEGALSRSWGRPSNAIGDFSGCCNPAHIALLPGGSLVTSEKGLTRIKVFSSEGSLLGLAAAPGNFAPGTPPLDIAADSAGRIYALDGKLRAVRVYERAPSRIAEM